MIAHHLIPQDNRDVNLVMYLSSCKAITDSETNDQTYDIGALHQLGFALFCPVQVLALIQICTLRHMLCDKVNDYALPP